MAWKVLLRSYATTVDGVTLRRGTILAALVLIERLTVPAVAWVVLSQSLATKLALGAALSVVLTARQVAMRTFSARTEAQLTARVIRGALNGNVLQASVLPDEDARAELGHAIYVSASQVSDVLPALLADIVASGLAVPVIIVLEPLRMCLLATVVLGLATLVLARTRRRLHDDIAAAWPQFESVQKALVDALEGRLEIVGAGEQDRFAATADDLARAWGRSSVKVASASLIGSRLAMVAVAGTVSAALALGMKDLVALSLRDLALFASLTPIFLGVGQGILSVARNERWIAAVARVLEHERPPPRGLPANSPSSTIEFEGASFRYDEGGPWAMSDVSFRWEGERLIALAGANGSGKSTVLRMLLALGQATVGAVQVDAVELARVDGNEWRRRLAFLPQRPYLPPRATVRQAIQLMVPDATAERMSAMLRRVGLAEARPDELPPLEWRLDAMSVGQRQRVAIARFLCRDAELFVLDEPDANLDRDGISLVVDLVRELSRERRVIVAAHTPELIAVADRVIELDRGRVVRDTRRRAE